MEDLCQLHNAVMSVWHREFSAYLSVKNGLFFVVCSPVTWISNTITYFLTLSF